MFSFTRSVSTQFLLQVMYVVHVLYDVVLLCINIIQLIAL